MNLRPVDTAQCFSGCRDHPRGSHLGSARVSLGNQEVLIYSTDACQHGGIHAANQSIVGGVIAGAPVLQRELGQGDALQRMASAVHRDKLSTTSPICRIQ